MNRSMILGASAGVLALAALGAAQAWRPLTDPQPASGRPAAASRPTPAAAPASVVPVSLVPVSSVPVSLVPAASFLVAQRRHVAGQVVLDLHQLESIDAAEDLALAEVRRRGPGGPPVCWLMAENAAQRAEALAILTQGACAEVRIAQ